MTMTIAFFDASKSRCDEIYEIFNRLLDISRTRSATLELIGNFKDQSYEKVNLPVSRKEFSNLQYLARLYSELESDINSNNPIERRDPLQERGRTARRV